MLIIGHRGAAGRQPGNTLASLHAGRQADVDILEFDVRLTKDRIPVLMHDPHLWRTHRLPYLVNKLTYRQLSRRTKGSVNPIVTLEKVLKEFGGQVLLNLELKDRGCAAKILPMLDQFIKKPADWDLFLFSSFRVNELKRIRKASRRAQLALLHWYNPLRFLFVNRQLELSAVGFHRLHVNTFVVSAAKRLGLFTYVYTVNRPQAAERLESLGVDAVVTDYPALIRRQIGHHH